MCFSTLCIKFVGVLNQRIFSKIKAWRNLVALVTKVSTHHRVWEKGAFKTLNNLLHSVFSLKLDINNCNLVLIAAICLFTACSSVDENISEVEIDITDQEIQKIFTFRDRHDKDSLQGYFDHPDPVYRYLSTLSFGSIQDTSYVTALAKMLKDPTDIVRTAAAFAIGQTNAQGSEEILLEAFNRYDTSGYYKKTNRAILEAIGKVGNPELLKNLSSISTYRVQDTTLLEGQAWGIYRFGIRNITNFEGTKKNG